MNNQPENIINLNHAFLCSVNFVHVLLRYDLSIFFPHHLATIVTSDWFPTGYWFTHDLWKATDRLNSSIHINLSNNSSIPKLNYCLINIGYTICLPHTHHWSSLIGHCYRWWSIIGLGWGV